MATKFSGFDPGGAIIDTDEVVGIGDVSADNERWSWLQVWTYIQAKVTALFAPLSSPALTGTPTAPTATPGTNTTQLATTAFVEAVRVVLDRSEPTAPTLLVDEFMFSSTETGEHGELGWSVTNGSANLVNPTADHPGILARVSSATIAQVCSMFTGGGGASPVMRCDQIGTHYWIVQPQSAVADHDVRIGVSSDMTSVTPTHGIYFEKLAADTNWFGVCSASGVQTRQDMGVAYGVAWAKLRIRRLSATTVGFTINGGTELVVSSNVPGATAVLVLGNHIVPQAAAARTVWFDYFSALFPALAR
jgi:hypothetical protein